MRKGASATLFIALLAVTGYLQWYTYETRKKPDFLRDRIMLVPEPETIKLLATGYDKTVVDLLWIRAIQYYAQHFSTLCRPPEKGEGLVDLFHSIIALDPDFRQAYVWGGFVLSESMNDPERCGTNGPRRAINEFLQPAMERFPNEWNFPREAAFVAMWHLGDNPLAAEYFFQACRQAGEAGSYMCHIALRLQADEGADLGFIMDQYLTRYLTSVTDAERETVVRHLYDVSVRMFQRDLEAIAKRYTEEKGHRPERLEDLVDEYFPARLGPQQPLPVDWQPQMVYRDLPIGPRGEEFVYLRHMGVVAVLQDVELYRRREMLRLQKTVDQFEEEYGHPPESMDALVKGLPDAFVDGIPQDPMGGCYVIDPLDGTVEVIEDCVSEDPWAVPVD